MYRPHWFLRNARKYRERDAALLRAVRPRPGLRLLEVGSARGDTAFFLAPLVGEVVGIDAAEPAPSRRREPPRRRAASRTSASRRPTPATSPPFAEGSFDAVLLADFVEHVTDDVLRPVPRGGPARPRPGRRARDLHAEPRPLGRAGQGRRSRPPAGGPHRRPPRGRGRTPRLGGGLPRRRPLLLREPLPAPRRARPPLPRSRGLPVSDRPPGAPPGLTRPRRRTRERAGGAPGGAPRQPFRARFAAGFFFSAAAADAAATAAASGTFATNAYASRSAAGASKPHPSFSQT